MAKAMYSTFRLSNDEYERLTGKFHDLCRFQAWQLLRRNLHNNHTDDLEDIEQDLLIALMKAGVYYKRQMYIEASLRAARRYAKDEFVKNLVCELGSLWRQRTKHGANKQKYGEPQERLLETLINSIVPESKRPKKDNPLVIDKKFARYCKQITWNQQKSLGRKITRERSIRNGIVSLSEFSGFFGERE